jgi:AcrR family transcriptional regulator
MSATAVVARAGVSRKTFYELFRSREDCYVAMLEDCLAQIAGMVYPAYEGESRWSERLRAALVALLAFLEREPEAGVLVLSYLVGHGPRRSELRVQVLEGLQSAVEEGRSQARSRSQASPLSGEFVVGGVLAVLHARVQSSSQLSALTNALMWMIVLPYLGPAAAAKELRRTAPKQDGRAARSVGDPVRALNLRLTYRTARVLEVTAMMPGASNVEISAQAGIPDQGQISKLLSRLARLGLIENSGAGQVRGAANSWHLTGRGREIELAISRKSALRRR